MDPNDRRTLYDAQWKAYLYQDELRWSRFKILATLEAGLVYAVFFWRAEVGVAWLIVLTLAGTALAVFIVLLARKDDADTGLHVRALSVLESQMWPEWGAALQGRERYPSDEALGEYIEEWRTMRPRGAAIMRATSVLIVCFNLVLLGKAISMA